MLQLAQTAQLVLRIFALQQATVEKALQRRVDVPAETAKAQGARGPLRAKRQRLGLVEIEKDWIIVTPRGRLLVRPICMVFDRYLRAAQQRARYSQVV